MSRGPLAGRGVLITRPREQAQALAQAVRTAGGEPVIFPAIEILPPADPEALERRIAELQRYRLAVFVSPTAARRGLEAVRARRPWPVGLRVAAVGEGTAAELVRLGVNRVIAPTEGADSEALAALAELRDVRGQQVLIFRGEGGREWLRAELERRGAQVDYAECYRRAPPAAPIGPLLARWQRGGIEAVVATSAEGLANLLARFGPTGRRYLCATPLFVPHQRIAAAAARAGVATVILAAGDEQRMVAAMEAFFAKV